MSAPHHSVFLHAGCSSCHPTNNVKALKAHFRDDTVLANNGQKLNGRRKKAYTQSNSTGGNDVAACGRLGVAACLACVVAAAVDRQARQSCWVWRGFERRVQTSDSLSATVLSRRESNLHAEADRTRTGLFCRVSPGGVNWLWSGPVWSSPVWPVYWNLAISEELQSLTWTGLSVEESTRMTEDWDKWRKYAYVHGVASRRIEDG